MASPPYDAMAGRNNHSDNTQGAALRIQYIRLIILDRFSHRLRKSIHSAHVSTITIEYRVEASLYHDIGAPSDNY